MYEFKLPDLGEGLSEAELLQWRVHVGDTIAEGDDVAEVSTDKVAVVLPSPRAGRVTELMWKPGDIVPVGNALLRMELSGDQAADASAALVPSATPSGASQPTFKAAPIVRRYAQEKRVDLARIAASVDGREITRQDIDAYLSSNQKVTGMPEGRRERLSGARLAAARRLTQSSRTLATTSLTCEVLADGILATTDASSQHGGAKLSPLAVIAACVCRALEHHTRFNAQIDEDNNELVLFDQINLGIAVDAPLGLFVPVILNAQRKSPSELGEAIAQAAEAARTGALTTADLQHATFTLSSTGGLERVALLGTTPIINVPNVATLWVSRIRVRPRFVAGKLEAGPLMSCSLSFDHRYINGAEGIAFLNSFDAAATTRS